MIFAPAELVKLSKLWETLGYEKVDSHLELENRNWQEAAKESMVPNTTLYFKKLRERRVMRPL